MVSAWVGEIIDKYLEIVMINNSDWENMVDFKYMYLQI